MISVSMILMKILSYLIRLKRHYEKYAPNMDALKSRYEAAMKEKMLANIERDRAVGQVTGLQSTLKSIETLHGGEFCSMSLVYSHISLHEYVLIIIIIIILPLTL